MEEFFALQLGHMTMEAYEKMFLEILKYAYFIKDGKVKIQRFLSGLPNSYKYKIQYDIPKTLKDAIWKEKHLYDKNKNKAPYSKDQEDKKRDKK